ncbi:hypothetical protein FRC09_018635 [Ceratobasidium sp. 395]|nr:hypothetical protein FRC09_018635 [Ceratobasidium sp. 395]
MPALSDIPPSSCLPYHLSSSLDTTPLMCPRHRYMMRRDPFMTRCVATHAPLRDVQLDAVVMLA